MKEHYTRNTLEVQAYCKKCGKQTFHRVDDRIKGPCLECIERFERAGIPVMTRKGDVLVYTNQATFDYLSRPHEPVIGNLICSCSQRPYPHELSVHLALRSESYNPKLRFQWPWSLIKSARVEPSAERKAA